MCWLCHPKLVTAVQAAGAGFLGCPGQAHVDTGLQLDGEEGQPCPGVTKRSPHHLCTLDIYGYSSPLLACLKELDPGPAAAGTQLCLSLQWGQLS